MNLLDASAVIASIMEEGDLTIVNKILKEPCAISAVNYSEVVLKLQKIMRLKNGSDGATPLNLIHHALYGMHLDIVAFGKNEAHALLTNPKLTGAQLSLADRICLATAITHNHTIVTADKMWATLELPLQITLIR